MASIVQSPVIQAAAVQAPAVTTQRDLRLDLFRGIALWLIFLDHVPNNILAWFTIRNYGFSDATEIFIFISGYTAAFVYGVLVLTLHMTGVPEWVPGWVPLWR